MPLQCDLYRLNCKTQKNYAQKPQKVQLQNQVGPDASTKKTRFPSTFYRKFKRKSSTAKIEKNCWQIIVAALMQPYIYRFTGPMPVVGMTPAAPAALTRFLSSPAAATLHGKTQGFVLWLSTQIKPHATFMQYDVNLQTKLADHPKLSIVSQV